MGTRKKAPAPKKSRNKPHVLCGLDVWEQLLWGHSEKTRQALALYEASHSTHKWPEVSKKKKKKVCRVSPNTGQLLSECIRSEAAVEKKLSRKQKQNKQKKQKTKQSW